MATATKSKKQRKTKAKAGKTKAKAGKTKATAEKKAVECRVYEITNRQGESARKQRATQNAERNKQRLGKLQTRILQTLAKSKSRGCDGANPGELTYAQVAKEAGVAINNLTQVLARHSRMGSTYPNSLESKGFVECRVYEITNRQGESVDSPYLWKITQKGRKAIKTV